MPEGTRNPESERSHISKEDAERARVIAREIVTQERAIGGAERLRELQQALADITEAAGEIVAEEREREKNVS